MVRLPSGSKSTRLAKSQMGAPGTNRTSVRIESLIFSHQHTAYSKRVSFSERRSHNFDAPDKCRAWRLPRPTRDHRAPPRPIPRWRRVLPFLHADHGRRFPNRHSEPDRSFPGRVQRYRPRHPGPGRLQRRRDVHISWPARVEPRFVLGYVVLRRTE
jgi:hypothetical protein